MSKRVDKILETIDQALDENTPWATGDQSSYEPGLDWGGCVRCGAEAEESGWCADCHPRNEGADPFERLKEIGEDAMREAARDPDEIAEARRDWLLQRYAPTRPISVPPWFLPVPGCQCEICAEARRLGSSERASGPEYAVDIFAPGMEPPPAYVEPGHLVTVERRPDGSTVVTRRREDIPEEVATRLREQMPSRDDRMRRWREMENAPLAGG